MIQINSQKGNTSCRDGPRLAMSNSTRTDHCGSRTAMVTCLNSIVRSYANAFVETVELATAAKPAKSSGNVRNDCSTVITNHQTGRSPELMLFIKLLPQKTLRAKTINQVVDRGRNATTDILTIVDCGCGKTHWLRLSHDWALRSESLRPNSGSQIVRRDC